MSVRVRVLQRHSPHHHVGLVRLRRLQPTYAAPPVRDVTLRLRERNLSGAWREIAVGVARVVALDRSGRIDLRSDLRKRLLDAVVQRPRHRIDWSAALPDRVLTGDRTARDAHGSLRHGVLALPTGLVFAVIGRIAVDVASDPTSHNLWPIEILIAGVVGLFWGFLAGGVGELILRGRRQSRR